MSHTGRSFTYMYLWSLTINFMAWSHEELDGISYRTEEQCVCARRFPSAHKIHTYPCVSSEHSPPLTPHNTHIHTHIYKKQQQQANMFICLTSDVYRHEL